MAYYLLFGDRIGTVHPRGPLAPRQKGGCSAQAPGDKQERQGLEISLDLDRVAYPSSRALLQVEAADPADIQIRLGDGVDTHCVREVESVILPAIVQRHVNKISFIC